MSKRITTKHKSKKKSTTKHKSKKKSLKQKDLSPSKRADITIIEGVIISLLMFAIDFAVMYCVEYFKIDYLKWTTVSGFIGTCLVNILTYVLYRKRMIYKKSINVIPLANAMSVVSSVLLSWIYLICSDNARLAVIEILSNMSLPFESINGNVIIDMTSNIMDMLRNMPTINVGHIIFVLGIILVFIFRFIFQKIL